MGRTSRIRKRRIGNQHVRPLVIDSNPEFMALCKWMSVNGWNATSKDCLLTKPAVFSDTGRGLIAMTNLAPNSLIVQIPQNLLITKEKVLLQEPALQQVKMTTAECLTFFVLTSKMNGLYPSYISTLPKEFSVGGLCENQEVVLLPKVLQNKITENQNYVMEKYQNLVTTWKKFFDPTLTFECFQWAWYCVNTRAVFYRDSDIFDMDGPENNMALAPYLDMFNHDPQAAVEAGYNKKSQCYEIRSNRKIKKHQQVFINYGPHDNQKLFLEYGFIAPRNPHNVVEFEFKLLSDLFPIRSVCVVPRRIALLRQLCKSGNLFCSEEGLSWNAQIALTLFSHEDAQLIGKTFSPLEILPNKYKIKLFSKKIVNALLLELTESLDKISLVSSNSTTSFQVAKSLIEDTIYVLDACLLNLE